MIDDTVVDDHNTIEQHIIRHFTKQFAEPKKIRPTLGGLTFSQVPIQQNSWLTRPFEESEVLAALDSMPHDKAPGMDGFPMGVLKHAWSFLKRDVMAILNDFHNT